MRYLRGCNRNIIAVNQVSSTAETIYNDQPNNYWVKNRSQIDADKWAEAITYFDGLGRAWKSEEVNSQGNIFVEKEFDAQGRVSRVTNPFRTGEAKQWTTNVYDEASRVKQVTLQDGATVKTDYGVSITAPVGVTKTITDQAGKKRKGFTDALGNMVRVIEDPTVQNLSTDYVFDTLGNLRKTTQGVQNRFFYHDSLGRLQYAKQPEQTTNAAFVQTDPVTSNTAWSVKYVYDDNGNITSTTDARNLSVTATYDNLNRLKVRDYSDSLTPDVSFYYDGRGLPSVPAYSKGKTTKVTSSVSETRYTSFDNLGRLLNHQQITDGQTYGTAYSYNLSGALIEETYPSGRVVRNTLDVNGDLSQVQSKKNASYGFFAYAKGLAYDSAGNVKKMQLGNGRWETALYNNRLQITQIGLGVTDNVQDLLKLELSYGTNAQNNGSLREQKITAPAIANPFIQTYTYDDLNRLQSAEEKVSTTTTWKQTFTIDRYGNRKFDAANTTTLGSCSTAICNPNINTSDNRFASGQGYSYDLNGNVTQDAQGQRFSYDAENHQKEFFAVGNGTATPNATYSYDGDGKRIKKISGTELTVFVYNVTGNLVAEYSTALATTPQVSYLTTDHLGSPRVITNEAGTVKDRKDFSAFGEESVTAQRSSNAEYSAADQMRKNYTGYEKDGESGLEFAQARYYNPTHGRFTSVDPLTASASIKNPQTFNRYSYVLNSPYKYTDPLGLLSQGTGADGGCNFRCRVMNAIGGKGTLSEADRALASFHIQNGTALGYAFLNASRAEISRPTPSSQPTTYQNLGGTSPYPSTGGTSYFSGSGGGNVGSGQSAGGESSSMENGAVILADAQPGTVHNVGRNFIRAVVTMGTVLQQDNIPTLYFGTIGSIDGFQGLLDMAAANKATSIWIYTHGDADNLHLGDGVPDDNNTINRSNVKRLVNSAPSLVDIRIFGCNAGYKDNGIARALAQQLNVHVYAATGGMIFSNHPTKPSGLKVHPNTGPTYLVHNGGDWMLFTRR